MESVGMEKRIRQSLVDWAEQGVLLLNTSLTTTKGCINAHNTIGWQEITRVILRHVFQTAVGNFKDGSRPTVFIAWGTYAQNTMKPELIKTYGDKILLLKGNHPAAVRHGYIFRGGEHFLKANEFLMKHGIKPIQWKG